MLIRELPPEANVPTLIRGDPHWSVTDHLLDEARMWLMAVAGAESKHIKPHPQRPRSVRPPDPARHKKLIDARKRASDRRRQIEAGEIT